ncbi:dehydrogenase [Nakamurella sp. YIM 132087]|uniref:Dehydrogenase n=1 Tax=Nakamurella alba TaxID=2665158 RepID=A0A7K1FEB5_9ACTN|nr:acyl-CoA dehydrogenase family protein [Nakamurella alba]MTD12431.1 dehydrogenase [Nakamurella alba]
MSRATSADFGVRARDWLEANVPRRAAGELPPVASVRDPRPGEIGRARRRQAALSAAGLAGISWPVEFGGAGLGETEERLFLKLSSDYDLELESFKVAMDLVGPTILAHGTDEQRSRYLPRILSGADLWCQLFSEPGAGSDLASLATRAELRDDGWHVTGQKVWTSGGHDADLAILVARTDFSVPKHRGLTYFVAGMHEPGVTVRPLRQMNGGSHFAEVFLDDVVLPADSVLGGVGNGWQVVRTTLGNERSAIGGDPGIEAEQLIGLGNSVARHRGSASLPDPVLVDAIVAVHVRNRALAALTRRTEQRAAAGAQPGPEASIFKLEYADVQRVGNDIAMRILGPDALLSGSDGVGAGAWQANLLTSPYLRIAGGTDEIQRNIIAERILQLPADREDGRSLPFDQLRRG